MKKHAAIIFLVSVMMACLLSGCAVITGADIESDVPVRAPTPVPRIGTEEPEPCSILDATGVGVRPGEKITFYGCSTLPDETELQTQLYADKKPAAWWPADKYIQVKNGLWQITVSLSGLSEDITKLYIGSETYFTFKIWEKDSPSVMAGYMFELMGPPAVSELEP